MSTETTVTGAIVATDRLRNSVNGNPRFRVHLDNGETYQTSTDSAVSYDIDNLARSRKRVTFLLTRAGRIWGYRDAN